MQKARGVATSLEVNLEQENHSHSEQNHVFLQMWYVAEHKIIHQINKK